MCTNIAYTVSRAELPENTASKLVVVLKAIKYSHTHIRMSSHVDFPPDIIPNGKMAGRSGGRLDDTSCVLRREMPALPLGVGDTRSLVRLSEPPRLDQPLLGALLTLLLDTARRAAHRIAAGAGAQRRQRALEELRVQCAVPLGRQVDTRPHAVRLVHVLRRRVLAPDRGADTRARHAAGHLERAEQVQGVVVRVAGELAPEALVNEATLQELRLVRDCIQCMCRWS